MINRVRNNDKSDFLFFFFFFIKSRHLPVCNQISFGPNVRIVRKQLPHVDRIEKNFALRAFLLAPSDDRAR